MRALVAGLAGAAVLGAAAYGADAAGDPPDMQRLAQTLAKAAPQTLSRQILGRRVIDDYAHTHFRNVRASYQRGTLVNDRITFCGEVNTIGPDGQPTGWLKFMYTPGDPPEFATERRDVGSLHAIGPEVRHRYCESGAEQWLSGDFAALMELPQGGLPPAADD